MKKLFVVLIGIGLFIASVWGLVLAEETGETAVYLPIMQKPAEPDICAFTELTDADDNPLGIIKVDVEAVAAVDAWNYETSTPDWRGNGYYRWTGADNFAGPVDGIISYTFQIEQSAIYEFRMRSYHEIVGEENDMWIRVDDGQWFKAFGFRQGGWKWATMLEVEGGGQLKPDFSLSSGIHTLQIAGRSNNFQVDQWTMYVQGGGRNGIDAEWIAQTECQLVTK